MNLIDFLIRELKEGSVCSIEIGTNHPVTITDKNQVSPVEGFPLIQTNISTRPGQDYTTTTKEFIPISAIKKITFIHKEEHPREIHSK